MPWISEASGFLRLWKRSYLLITDKLTLDCTRGHTPTLTSDGTAQLCGPALNIQIRRVGEEKSDQQKTGNIIERDKKCVAQCAAIPGVTT